MGADTEKRPLFSGQATPRSMNRIALPGLAAFAMALTSAPLSAQSGDAGVLSLDSLLNIRVSSAARYEQTTKEAAASTSVVTREDIERFGWRNLGELLSSLGGFYVTSDRSFGYLGARGFSRPSDHNNRVLFLVDGHARNGIIDAQASLEEGVAPPMEHIERVEVVRGPGSALYGSSAMLAVVNVVTRSARDGEDTRVRVEGGEAGFRTGALSLAGRAGASIRYSAFASWLDKPAADAYFPEFDVPGLSDGWALGKDSRETYTAGAKLDWGPVELSAMAGHGTQGDPTAPYGSSLARPLTHSSDRLDLYLTYSKAISPRVRLDFQADYLNSDLEITIPFDQPVQVNRLARSRGTRWGGEAQVMLDLTPSHRLILGGSTTATDPDLDIGDSFQGFHSTFGERIDVASVFAQHEWQARANLSVVAGARMDRYSTAGSALSPRGAIVYHASAASTFKLLYGGAFRAPTALEQFIEEGTILVANPDLEPENIRTVEVVWEQRVGGGVFATASAFDYEMKDLISQGLDPDVGALTYMNLASVHGRGIGLDVTGRLSSGVIFYVNGTLQEASDDATGEPLVNSPSYLLRAGASAMLPYGFGLSASVARDGDRNTYRGAPVDGVWLAGMHVRSPAFRGLAASLSVRNLFDAEYGYPAGLEHRQVSIPQTGRSIRLTISATF